MFFFSNSVALLSKSKQAYFAKMKYSSIGINHFFMYILVVSLYIHVDHVAIKSCLRGLRHSKAQISLFGYRD